MVNLKEGYSNLKKNAGKVGSAVSKKADILKNAVGKVAKGAKEGAKFVGKQMVKPRGVAGAVINPVGTALKGGLMAGKAIGSMVSKFKK